MSSPISGPGGRPLTSSRAGRGRVLTWTALAAALALALALSACSSPAADAPAPSATPAASTAPVLAGDLKPASKVMIIVEENKTYDDVLNSAKAPYLKQLSQTHATLTHLDAGYPPRCPSLAAYILMTSGQTSGICDDRNPVAHPLTSASIFEQLTTAGRSWRSYAEAMPGNCWPENSADGKYLVRHVPATYYLPVRAACDESVVPLGDTSDGALISALTQGSLPEYSFVTPDACNDMHGSSSCPDHELQTGNAWLQQWIPRITGTSDYRSGRLLVLITWDEGNRTSNHIPTVVLSAHASGVTIDEAVTHCSLLRLTQDILTLPPLGCAASAPSIRAELHA